MMANAFCPAHITGFFKAELENKKSLFNGSLGAGISLQEGVTTSVLAKKSETNDFQINVKGYMPDNLKVSEYVIKKFLGLVDEKYFVDVSHDISIPVGYGLGSSAAVALSLSLALNQALKINLSKIKVGQIAHDAEIFCKTGLGDVIASYHGGFEIRKKSGAPGIGRIEKINTKHSSVIMLCFSPISTNHFIKEKLPSINGLGGKMVNQLAKSKSCDEFQDMSVEFAKYVKILTPRMNSVIVNLHRNKIKCGIAMFGETVFTIVSDKMEDIVLDIFKKYDDGVIIKSKIDNVGARLT